jgi:hypothetical protein
MVSFRRDAWIGSGISRIGILILYLVWYLRIVLNNTFKLVAQRPVAWHVLRGI